MRRFYEQTLWIPQKFLLTNLDLHHGLLGIAKKYGYEIYDALIAASALEAGCATLSSEDLQHRQVHEGRLTVRNPFR